MLDLKDDKLFEPICLTKGICLENTFIAVSHMHKSFIWLNNVLLQVPYFAHDRAWMVVLRHKGSLEIGKMGPQ